MKLKNTLTFALVLLLAMAPLGGFATSLPGAPDGDYVVLQFATKFENNTKAIETVTPMLNEGHWRVSGYYVR